MNQRGKDGNLIWIFQQIKQADVCADKGVGRRANGQCAAVAGVFADNAHFLHDVEQKLAVEVQLDTEVRAIRAAACHIGNQRQIHRIAGELPVAVAVLVFAQTHAFFALQNQADAGFLQIADIGGGAVDTVEGQIGNGVCQTVSWGKRLEVFCRSCFRFAFIVLHSILSVFAQSGKHFGESCYRSMLT